MNRVVCVFSLLFAVVIALPGYGDVEITQSGRYTGTVLSNQANRFSSVSYLVRVPEGKRVEIQVVGEREAANTDLQTIKVAFSSSVVAYRTHVFDANLNRSTSFESRTDTTVELSSECSPDSYPSAIVNPVTGAITWGTEYYTSFYCNLSYAMDVTYYDCVPDLTVSSVSTDPSDSVMKWDDASLNFLVKNTGEKSAAKTKAQVFDGATKLGEVAIDELSSGASCNKSFALPSLSVGEHSLSVSVVAVSGEKVTSNNSKGTSLMVCDATPYTVRFNANGGVGTMADQSFVCGTVQRLRKNEYYRDGYKFAGWGLSCNGDALFFDEEEVKNLTWEDGVAVMLYAIWNEIEYFNVRFDSDGGEGTMEMCRLTPDGGERLPPCKFDKEGHAFIGWSVSDALTEAPIVFIDEERVGVEHDSSGWTITGWTYAGRWSSFHTRANYMTLKAVWGVKTLRVNGSSESELDYYTMGGDAQWSESNVSVLPSDGVQCDFGFHSPQDVACYGYVPSKFDSYRSKAGNYFGTNWLAVCVLGPGRIEFKTGISCCLGAALQFSVDGCPMRTVECRGGLFPTRGVYWYPACQYEIPDGKHILMWAFNASGFVDSQAADYSHTSLCCAWAGDILWQQESVKVHFDSNGGTDGEVELVIYPGATIGTLPTAIREGYEFLGWFTAAVGGAQVTVETVITSQATFYAHWRPITCCIRFDANDGAGMMEPFAMEPTKVYKLPKCTLKPPTGRTKFVGWYSSVNGKLYDDEMLVFGLGDVTMTAIWE